MPNAMKAGLETLSLPSRERGLKLTVVGTVTKVVGSLPSRERGLKLNYAESLANQGVSLPSRERGLK